MVIKNETTIKEENIKAVMHASNFDNSRYKIFKVIYNTFGLVFGMMMVHLLMPLLLGKGTPDYALIIIYGIACVVLLYIGMYGMDRNNYARFRAVYSNMVGHTFRYEIDSEEIAVSDEEETETIGWEDITKWAEDTDNIYLFLNNTEALIISKAGFKECRSRDLKELAAAIMGVREEEKAREEGEEEKKEGKEEKQEETENDKKAEQ